MILSKYGKLLTFSILSLLLYFFVDNSDSITQTLQMVVKSNSHKAMGVYILLIIGKYFLFLFGVLGLAMFSYRMLQAYFGDH